MIRNYSGFLVFFLTLIAFSSKAATFYSRTSGNWTNASTWSTVSCGGAAAATIPGALDNVIICAGHTITMNGNPANCLSLTMSGTASWSTGRTINIGTGGLTMNPGSDITGLGGPNIGTLNVAGDFTVNTGGTSSFHRGNLTVAGTTNIFGTFAIQNTTGNKTFQNMNITGGTFSSNASETYIINGNVVLTNGTITGSSTGVFEIAGTFTTSGTSFLGAGTLTVTGLTTIYGTLNENSATGTKTFTNIVISSGATWNNLSAETYDVSGTLTMNGGTITGASIGRYNITGGFTVASGTNTLAQSLMNVTGPTQINSVLNITSINGTKTFGDITISASGNWNCTVAEDFVINGNFTNNGLFTSNTGTYQLAGTNKIISGSALSAFSNLNNTGSYTNNGQVQVIGSHYGAGSFSQGATGLYFQGMLSANFTVTTFNASAAGNLVTYNLAGAQNVRIPSDGAYHHLTTAGSGIKTFLAATTVGGNLIISTGTTLATNNFSMIVRGNITNNGSFTAGTSTVTLNGTALQTIGGSVVTTFNNLIMNNAAGASLSINTVVGGVLNFTAGVITTGSNKVTIFAGGSVTGAATSRFVNGFLEKNIAAGAAVVRMFEIGNGTTNYLPVSLNFASVSVSGNITANVSNTDHPGIASSCIDNLKSVNHYWTLANTGTVFTTYSAACTFIGAPTDADAGSVAANYYMSVFSSGTWTLLSRGTVTGTVNQGMGITALGDLQIGERAVPTIPVQPASDSVCENTAAVFSITVSGVGLNYQWQQNTGSGYVNVVDGGIYSGANTNILTISSAALGMDGYLYQCVISNNCSPVILTSNACALNVIPGVPAGLTVSVNPSTTICAGTNVTFTALPVNPGTSPVYQWVLNGVNVGTNSTVYSNAALNNNDQVTCIMTSNAQCVFGSPVAFNTSMTVNPNLPVSVSISATSSVICPGTNVNFTATPVNEGTSPVYQWILNGANVGINSSAYSNSTLVDGDVISCIVTSNAVCATGSPAASNNITITVNPLLPVSVSVSAAPAGPVCSGTNVVFNASPVNGGGTPVYQWLLNGSNVGSNSPTYSNAALVNGDMVSCILTSAASCATGSPATSNTVTMVVNPNLPLSVSISASTPTTICAGDNVIFTATPVNGAGYESYQWQVNGMNVGSNSAVYSSASISNGDAVTCILTTAEPCVTGNPATSNTINFTVNPVAPVSVSVSQNPVGAICSGTNVIFTANPVNPGGGPSYQWYLNGGATGSNSTTFSSSALADNDVITVVLTSDVSCASGNPASSVPITIDVDPVLPVSVTIGASPAGTVCAGTQVDFTASPVNGGGTPSYQWLVNGAAAGSNSSIFSVTTLNNGDVISCVLTSNVACPSGSPAGSNTITQSIVSSGGWAGVTSTDWNTVSNWCGGVPTSASNVSITSGTVFSPVLTALSSCNNLTIGAGAGLNLNDQVLNVSGSISGTGLLTGSDMSSLNFIGAGSGGNILMDQSVPGISNTLLNLTFNRAAGSVALGNAMNIKGTVDIVSGTLNTGGNLTLISDASGTARIGQLAGAADVSGNVTVQRFIPGGTDGWMFISSPVTGATLQNWDDDFVTGGFPGSFYPPSPNASIVTYDESLPGLYDDGYVDPSGITDPITARKGYWAYIMNTPVTIDVTGPILKKTQNFAMTYTDDPAQDASEDGWNLVANPYPSTIDWDGAGWTKNNINDAIYMYSPTLEQYTSYVGGIGTNGGSNLIASSQSFLVQASGPSPVLQLTESGKESSDAPFLRSGARTSSGELIKLNLNGNGYSDETIIHFNNAATVGFDLSYDALKFFSFNSDVPGLGTVLDTTLLSVNTFPELNSDLVIPIKVKVGVSGNYTISLDAVSVLPEVSCIILKDLQTGLETDLRTTPSVSYHIVDTTVSPRFVLKIGQKIPVFSMSSTCNGNSDGEAVAVGTGTAPWNYTWMNNEGSILQVHTASFTADTLKNIQAGLYTVIIDGNSEVCPSTITQINVPFSDSLSFTSVISNADCSGTSNGSVEVNFITGGVAPYIYNWSNGASASFNGSLSAGDYVLSLSDSAGCVQQESFTVGLNNLLSAGFTVSNDSIHLSDDNEEAVEFSAESKQITSYQWDFGDGTATSTSPNPSHWYSLPGTYTVSLIASGGNCTDTSYAVIVVTSSLITSIAGAEDTETILITENNYMVDITFNMTSACNASVAVCNTLGQEVFERRKVSVCKDRLSYDLSFLTKGVYYIRVTAAEGRTVVKKIVRS
jgi:hypothetical protein